MLVADWNFIQTSDASCRRYFTYQKDTGPNTWRSALTSVLQYRNWSGDCDDLASTVLHYIVDMLGGSTKEAVDLTRLWRLKVKTTQCPKDQPYDHMVGAVEDNEGRIWIVGDTFEKPTLIHKSIHGLIRPGTIAEHSQLSEGILWRTGVGDILPFI